MYSVLLVDTGHDTFTIHNLKRIWIDKKMFIYRLMYTDESTKKNCIFWSFNRNELEKCKNKILRAYKNEMMVNL